MRQTSKAEKIENCLIGLALLDELPANKIIKGLGDWATKLMCTDINHCGAAACFGGWVAVTPYFQQKYGIYAAKKEVTRPSGWFTSTTLVGQPRTRMQTDTEVLAERLFGYGEMFRPNWSGSSDKAEIRRRLKEALADLVPAE